MEKTELPMEKTERRKLKMAAHALHPPLRSAAERGRGTARSAVEGAFAESTCFVV
jgi:hypothetical protein